MPRQLPLTFATLVGVTEVRPALAAVREVLDCVCTADRRRVCNPLYLHGPAGSGKSHLAAALAHEASRRNRGLVITTLAAGDRETLGRFWDDDIETTPAAEARASDLFVAEDLQHLPVGHARAFTRLFDELLSRSVQMVFTARVGPRQLDLPTRLTSRLASGLVTALEAPSIDSRREILVDRAARRQLAVRPEVLDWLARHLTGGGRQLDGALTRLEQLGSGGRHGPPDVNTILAHFREEADLARPSVEQVAQRVGRRFQVELRVLRSDRRGRGIVLPRQVGMYLARQLTGLSLEKIGAYFGGRDHTTVLHACRKVEKALAADAALSGTVRQLYQDMA
jgi:chromosomal replication initiator protein